MRLCCEARVYTRNALKLNLTPYLLRAKQQLNSLNLMSFTIALIVSFVISLLLIKFNDRHSHFSSDDDFHGAQKIHHEAVPRIGGVAVLMGLLFGFLSIGNEQTQTLIVASLPLFTIGLIEDLTKKIPPIIRLLTALIAAGIAVFSLDIAITSVDIGWIDDNLLRVSFLSLLLTIVMIGGVAHATNIIDGFNGLLLGYAMLASLVFLWVAFKVDDGVVASTVLALLGAILGLFLFNFPQAKIFTGDGGAYLIGFLLALIALLLIKNNSQISPWMPLLVLIYPVFETLFSIYRKKILRGGSPFIPDGIHLHLLLYKRVANHHFAGLSKHIGDNATTSVLLGLLVAPFMLPAVFWWHSTVVMIAVIICFCVCYACIYFAIVRFSLRLPASKKLT